MGIDFIRRTAPTFRKAWDRRRVELCTPDLLTRPIAEGSRTIIAEMVGRKTLRGGDEFIFERSPGSAELLGRIGMEIVARAASAPKEIVSAVEAGAGVARAKVEKVHKLSGLVEVSLS